MEFLCDMWRFSAEEYMAFLSRRGIENFGVYITFRNRIAIYADEDKYLDVSINDQIFNQDEKQLIKLLERAEVLVDKFMEFMAKFNAENIEDKSLDFDEDE